jgi:hypothetical protein
VDQPVLPAALFLGQRLRRPRQGGLPPGQGAVAPVALGLLVVDDGVPLLLVHRQQQPLGAQLPARQLALAVEAQLLLAQALGLPAQAALGVGQPPLAPAQAHLLGVPVPVPATLQRLAQPHEPVALPGGLLPQGPGLGAGALQRGPPLLRRLAGVRALRPEGRPLPAQLLAQLAQLAAPLLQVGGQLPLLALQRRGAADQPVLLLGQRCLLGGDRRRLDAQGVALGPRVGAGLGQLVGGGGQFEGEGERADLDHVAVAQQAAPGGPAVDARVVPAGEVAQQQPGGGVQDGAVGGADALGVEADVTAGRLAHEGHGPPHRVAGPAEPAVEGDQLAQGGGAFGQLGQVGGLFHAGRAPVDSAGLPALSAFRGVNLSAPGREELLAARRAQVSRRGPAQSPSTRLSILTISASDLTPGEGRSTGWSPPLKTMICGMAEMR